MSYRTWITYGYGVKMKNLDITNLTSDMLADFIHLAPYFEEKYIAWVEKNFRKEGDPSSIYEILPIDNLLEYESEDACYTGLLPILKGVLDEAEGLYFVMCHNYDNEEFLLFTPAYPWEMSKREREMSRGEVEKIYKKYIGKLTDKEFEIDYYEVENGG